MTSSTVAALRRAEQVYYEQISERATLPGGLAFHAPDFPSARGDNSFREVLIETADDVDRAWTAVEAFYAEHNLRCLGWVPSLDQRLELIEPFLLEKGLAKRSFAALAPTSWPDLKINDRVRVLPARAMRRAFRELHASDEHAELAERRLDDSQFDVFVATLDGRAAGRCGLLQVGEVAQVADLFVAEDFRRSRIGSTLLSHVLEMARRLLMRTVCLKLDTEDQVARKFCEHLAFEADGELIEFHRL